MTQIEWTHLPGFRGESWNPIVGCEIVSKGCTNCYAMKQAARILRMTGDGSHYAGTVQDSKAGPVWSGKVARASENALTAPLRAREPRCYFVNSMGDLFAEAVPDEWIDQVFAIMSRATRHRFIVLTKRPRRMRDYLKRLDAIANGNDHEWFDRGFCWPVMPSAPRPFPFSNIWLGVSVEDQASADARIPLLLDTPAAVRFISAEPLLGPVDLEPWLAWPDDLPDLPDGRTFGCPGCEIGECGSCPNEKAFFQVTEGPRDKDGAPEWIDHERITLDWVITGGESGPDARPMHPDWARSLRDQCAAAGVPFFFKQWGRYQTVYDRDVDDPDWRQCGSIADTTPKGRWLNLEGGHGFHGERVVRVDPVGKRAAGHLLDGVEHFNWPDDPAGGVS
ncbi:MAG: protein gp37 [Maricaulis maris]|jgi:protein gp37